MKRIAAALLALAIIITLANANISILHFPGLTFARVQIVSTCAAVQYSASGLQVKYSFDNCDN